MDSPLRILFVADRPDDRNDVIRGLEKDFPGVEVTKIREGASFAESIQEVSFDIVITDDQLQWSDGLAVCRRIKTRNPDIPVILFTDADHEEIAVKAMKSCVDDYVIKSTPRFAGLSAIVHSLLQRRREKKEEAETRYKDLFEYLPMGLFRSRPEGEIIDANPALLEILGYPDRQSLLGTHVSDLHVQFRDRLNWEDPLRKDEGPRPFEVQVKRRDGGTTWVRANIRAVYGREGKIQEYEGTVEDIADFKRIQENLRESRQRLRAMAMQMGEMEEAERRRLARELHDRVSQNMTALGINLGILRGLMPAGISPRINDRLRDAEKLAEETSKMIREVMSDLRPAVLDDYGLLPALHGLADQFAERTGIAAVVKGKEGRSRPSRVLETALFRIAQEALTNIAKHGEARQALITLEMKRKEAALTVEDDGKGFEVEDLPGPGEKRGRGLSAMRGRTEALGGSLTVDSKPGKGTKIIAILPFSSESEDRIPGNEIPRG